MVGEEKKGGFEGLRARLDAEREREGGGAGLATGILAEDGGHTKMYGLHGGSLYTNSLEYMLASLVIVRAFSSGRCDGIK